MIHSAIVREFQFTRDFRAINWRATLWYNLLRASMAGIVIAVISLVLQPSPHQTVLGSLATIPLMPVGYLFLILPMTLMTSLLRWVPFVGIIGVVMALTVAIGDPLVCLLKRVWPAAVPVEEPTLFSLTPVFWVLNVDEYAIAG